jgi:biopolymer transport protein ExbD
MKEKFDQQVNEYIYNLFEKIQEEIIIKGDDRVQRDEMYTIIEKIVKENIGQLQVVVDSRIKVS